MYAVYERKGATSVYHGTFALDVAREVRNLVFVQTGNPVNLEPDDE